MRHVVMVPPAVSYAVLGAGLVISLLIAWRAYDTFRFLAEAETVAGAYQEIELTR